MTSIGEALIAQLVARDVDVVFGIPGVHTVELYRGLAASGIRHITPRHEQGAGFMADGYARISGKPGVALVITGPGLTNTLTPMAQARADSVPMLVLSGVNALPNLGKGLGLLHELPDQRAVASSVAITSDRVEDQDDLTPLLDKVFTQFATARPGPAHIEIPLDVARFEYAQPIAPAAETSPPQASDDDLARAAELLQSAKAPVILAGGGARGSNADLQALAERLDAPVVLTANARGMMHRHRLCVPASPSLEAVRKLIEDADVVLALGTELGQTDYDVNATGSIAPMKSLIRVDICPWQLQSYGATLALRADAGSTIRSLLELLAANSGNDGTGTQRAEETRQKAFDEIGPEMRTLVQLLDTIREAVPGAIMVGDSTQLIYAGNLYYDHDRPGGWFNAATGYGALGYGIPAAIGAALAEPKAPVLCITGDGGAQFTLPELMVAVDENLPITFVIWNNHGYREIATWMKAADVTVIGCDPTPPDFSAVAASCGIPFRRCGTEAKEIAEALRNAMSETRPSIVEIDASDFPFTS
ncbi:5-guanidino-2-oxopentanoate decarboxylase [Hoeflea sp. TYP-13]|uniref:5-guanidino-2-oxopentanoate decarboxylase n=1 Tax=Hoeflea sp. TYP-13 TaxID=3230023 RepID=UPI0034C68B83